MEDLFWKISIDDILQYIMPEKRFKRVERRMPSSLERIVRIPIKTEMINPKETKLLEGSIVKENLEPVIVSYELFIPTDKIVYSKSEIKYVARRDSESLDIDVGAEKIEIDRKKKTSSEYAILFSYDKVEQGYHVKYVTQEYSERIEKTRQDFTSRLDKALEILPKSLMGGVLGFTYLGSGKMARRADLFGDMAKMVDVHEAIHTPDEYETRVLTSWMLRMERPKYKR